MKKTTALFLMLFALLALVSCGAKTAPDKMTAVEHRAFDCVLYIPETWSDDKNNLYIAATAPDGKTSVSVMFKGKPDGETLENCLDAYSAGLEKNFSAVSLTDTQDITLDGMNAKKFVFNVETGGKTYILTVVYSYFGGNAYTVTYTSSPESGATYDADFEKMLTQFKFTGSLI